MFYNNITEERSLINYSDLEEYFIGNLRYLDIPRTDPDWGFNDIADSAFANLTQL